MKVEGRNAELKLANENLVRELEIVNGRKESSRPNENDYSTSWKRCQSWSACFHRIIMLLLPTAASVKNMARTMDYPAMNNAMEAKSLVSFANHTT